MEASTEAAERTRVSAVTPSSGAASLIERLRGEGRSVLVYSGGYDRPKNVPFLIEVLREMTLGWTGPPPALCLVGDPGPAIEPLLERAGSAGLASARSGLSSGHVHCLGRLTDEDLAAVYGSADLFVSASLYEGFGLPALEAMACGCPVVALACGTVPEVLDDAAMSVGPERCEKRLDPGAAPAFARAARSVLADEVLRRDLVEKGLRRAGALTWERTARETRALYHELVDAPAGDRRG